jgi:putative pyruvate formate lyase activating enzyme
MTNFEPAYLNLLRSGELKERVKEAYKRLEACDVCPRECGVNRRESAKARAAAQKDPKGLKDPSSLVAFRQG